MTDALTQYLFEVEDRAFSWSKWNCAHFTSGWVSRRRGFDPGFALGGHFSEPRGFAAAVRQAGHRSFLEAVAATAARNRIAPVAATAMRRGDVGVIRLRRPVLSICLGGSVFVVNSSAGLSIGEASCIRGWSIA